MLFSVQPRNRMFGKDYRFLTFAKNIGTNIGKNISKNLRDKYSQKRLDYAKPSAADALEIISKRVIQKTAETTFNLIGNKMANRITKSQEVHSTIIQKQLQISMIKKYLKRGTCLQ